MELLHVISGNGGAIIAYNFPERMRGVASGVSFHDTLGFHWRVCVPGTNVKFTSGSGYSAAVQVCSRCRRRRGGRTIRIEKMMAENM